MYTAQKYYFYITLECFSFLFLILQGLFLSFIYFKNDFFLIFRFSRLTSILRSPRSFNTVDIQSFGFLFFLHLLLTGSHHPALLQQLHQQGQPPPLLPWDRVALVHLVELTSGIQPETYHKSCNIIERMKIDQVSLFLQRVVENKDDLPSLLPKPAPNQTSAQTEQSENNKHRWLLNWNLCKSCKYLTSCSFSTSFWWTSWTPRWGWSWSLTSRRWKRTTGWLVNSFRCLFFFCIVKF